MEFRRKSSVHAENLFFDQGRYWQTIKCVGKDFPQFNGIPALALIVKAIDAIDSGRFVISPEDEKVFRVLNFVGEQKTNGFKRLLAPIDVVSQEEIVGFRGKASVFQ
jgi:hypothetical protein